MTFLPEGYKVPQTKSKYFKPQDGENRIRILGPVVMGWEDWKEGQNGSRTPVRTKYEGENSKPKALGESPVKHFWAFPVYDYADGEIKVFEATQATIQNGIYTYHMDEDFGDPTGYDIKIVKEGKKLETSYDVVAKPPKEMDEEIKVKWKAKNVDCTKLFTNDDPFVDSKEEVETVNVNDEELNNMFPDKEL